MPETHDSLKSLSEEMANAFLPLGRAIADPLEFQAYMRDLGWDFTGAVTPFNALGERITRMAERLGTPSYTAVDVLCDLTGLTDDLRAIAAGALPNTIDPAEFQKEFSHQLVDHVLVDYLMGRFGAPGPFLLLIGAIRVQQMPANAATKRLAHLRKSIAWNDFTDLLSDPTIVFTRAYNWGTPNFRGQEFLANCAGFFRSIGIEVRNDYPPAAASALLDQGALVPPVYGDQVTAVPLVDNDPAVSAGAGFSVRLLSETAADLPGFSIVPAVYGAVESATPITEEQSFILEVTGDFSGAFGISARPGNIGFRADLLGTGDMGLSGDLAVWMGFRSTALADPGYALISNDAGSGVFIKTAEGKIGARFANDGAAELLLEAALRGGKIIAKTSEADGFLQVLLGGQGIEADFDLSVGWSNRHGVFLGEGNGIEILIPLHLQLGPISITAVMIGLKPDGRSVELLVAADAGAALGPLQFVVQGVGLKALFSSPTEQNGNLGPVALAIGFKPPVGAGLSLDAGAVTGGGFLYIDPDRGEYAGILQLSLLGFLTITAMGIITTRMPDGSDGFSLLVIISVSFEPGIQLSYGFTLGGLGGILGLNRTMVLEALAMGARTGTINAILFPVGDIIPQAPRIISDLRAIFPPEEGKFLIGPMAKIGWGTPTLISVSMGVIIEIPGNIAIVGVLRAGLPTEREPLVVIQVAFVGAIDFGKGHLFFFAALFESRLLFMTLDGEMGLLLAWGGDPNFVLSIGGFHPRFDPPPLPFPVPAKLALTILNEEFGKIRLEAYLAITSNTAQFGARAELFFGNQEFSVSGGVQFDTLLRFSPFYLITEVSSSMTLTVFGCDSCAIRLEFTLEGPTPWKARGKGSVSVVGFDYDVDFSESWGDAVHTVLPPVSVLPLLRTELEVVANWKTVLPPASNLLTSIGDLSAPAGTLVMHPLGSLRFSQRLVPIGLTIDKLGHQRLADAERFDLESDTPGLSKRGSGNERFAMAQFIDMGDAEKLSRPSFESVPGGIELGVEDDLRTSHAACRRLRYEEIWIDSGYKKHLRFSKGFDHGLFTHFVRGAAISRNPLSAARKNGTDPFVEKVSVSPDMSFAVADIDTNAVHASGGVFGSHAIAREMMDRAIATDSTLTGRLVILPENELAESP